VDYTASMAKERIYIWRINLENHWQRRTQELEQECHNSSSTTNQTQTAWNEHKGSQQ
jgi:hypothetical protein